MTTKEMAIRNKLLKAKTLLNETDVLMQFKFYSTVVNRLYYASFHATKALLLAKDITPKTHNGVVAALHQHYVKPGNFEMNHASFYSRLMQERINGDYSDEMELDENEVAELIEPAKAYIRYIEIQINPSLNIS